MMVDILIPNYNGREALELCIESIAAHTLEKHRVVVYDDASTHPGDHNYLIRAYERGWVDKIIAGKEHGGHGVSLNRLINGSDLTTRYVVIMDNDVQVLRGGWLSGLLGLASNPHVLVVSSEKSSFGFCSRGYRPGMFLLWFGLLNMTAYRDGMMVDWSLPEARRTDEPWQKECAPLYPPEDNPVYEHTRATWGECQDEFDPDKVVFDPGCLLWCKMRYENPKNYIHQDLTPNVLSSFRHWVHGQAWLEPRNEGTERGQILRAQIKTELERLRCS